MRYINLRLAMDRRRCRQFMLADLLKMSDASFSRKMHGRGGLDFLPHEKCRIAEYLRFDVLWLFAEAAIPASARRETAVLIPAAEMRYIPLTTGFGFPLVGASGCIGVRSKAVGYRKAMEGKG